jgi:hypothetical protein
MKIAIGVPTITRPSIEWAVNLAIIAKETAFPLEILVSKHYAIDKARNNLVMAARNAKATHILFLDQDILPCLYQNGEYLPFPHFINFMASFHYPVVSGLYASKKDSKPAVYRYTGDELKPYETIDATFENLVNNISFVNATALGCLLVDMRVFDVLEKNGYFPWFEYKTDWKKGQEISEDINFCDYLRRSGFSIMLLGQLVCKHETSSVLLPEGKFEYQSLGGS